MKVAKPVNRQQLVNAIAAAEANGPLTNRQALYGAVAERYNVACGPTQSSQWITSSIVLLRIKEWGLSVKTPVGKRGRPAGCAIPRKLDDQGNPIPRKRKGRKASETNLNAMREGEFVGEQYKGLLQRIENGSLTARVKANCLTCAGFMRTEIANCGCTGCPLWDVRPYQNGAVSDATETEEVAENSELVNVG
jgi:hypothetical protein